MPYSLLAMAASLQALVLLIIQKLVTRLAAIVRKQDDELLPKAVHDQLPKDVTPVFVDGSKMVDGAPFPLTLAPSAPGAGDAERIAFVHSRREMLHNLLNSHGAVLLRGWGCPEAGGQHFSELSAALGLETTEMACSAGPRNDIAPGVFTANEAPHTERIPFHHEMAQCDAPPSVVLFYCEAAAPVGGATPVVQSHLAARHLRARHPTVAAKLARVGIRYLRTMPPVTDPSSALGKSWKNSLRVETKEEAEAALRALGATWTWLPGDMLRTVTKSMDALLTAECSGREVFFTAAESTFNDIEDEVVDETPCGGPLPAAAAAKPKAVRPVKAIIYGDGSPLDTETKLALHDVSEYMQRIQVALPWQPGDALLLNNATVQHSRQSFTPPRRILASLVGGMSKEDGVLRPAAVGAATACSRAARAKAGLSAVSPSSTMDTLPDRFHSVPLMDLDHRGAA